MAASVNLNDADRTAPGPAQIIGEVDEQAVGVIIGSVDDRGDVALGIEPHVPYLTERCIRKDTSRCAGLQADIRSILLARCWINPVCDRAVRVKLS